MTKNITIIQIQISPLLLIIKPRTTTEKSDVAPHMPLQPKESNPRNTPKSNEASNKTQEKNSASIQQNTSSSNKAQNNVISNKDVTKKNQDASLASNNVTKNSKLISPPTAPNPENGIRTRNIPNKVDNQNKQSTTITSQQIQVPKQNQEELPKLNKQNEHTASTQKSEKVIVVGKKK